MAVALLAALTNAKAQAPSAAVPSLNPDWRPIGASIYESGLASPATGPVERVWFSNGGDRLYARTASGRVYESGDEGEWRGYARGGEPGPPPTEPGELAASLPEPRAVVRSADSFHARLYAFGRYVYRSEDGGRHWVNLTAHRGDSIIGDETVDLAVSPLDPDVLVVANGSGVWRSADGGLSWVGLNETLPNLPAVRILSAPAGVRGVRISTPGGGVLEWAPGEKDAWRPGYGETPVNYEGDLEQVSARLGARATAVALAEGYSYAGSDNGRVWASIDGGENWYAVRDAGARVLALAPAAARPSTVFAAVAGMPDGGGRRVLRSLDSGASWEDLTGDLPPGDVRGLAVDPAASAVYVASTTGVYLRMLHGTNQAWIPLSANLVRVPPVDVKLDAAGSQVYVAMEGYGIYAAPAPHRFLTVQVVNSADFSDRPAAPGSLLTVLGGRLVRAQAGFRELPVLHAADGEAQIQVPFEMTGTSAQLALELARGRVALNVAMAEVSPAIFVDREGSALLLDAATGTVLDRANPAARGARVQILATGLGRVTPRWPTGAAAPLDEPPRVDAEVRAYLDQSPLEVTRATLAPGYVGFYLVEVRLPMVVNGGAAGLFLWAGGRESNRVRIDLEP